MRPFSLLLVSLFIAGAAQAQSDLLTTQAGNCTRVETIPGGYAFRLDNGYARITAYSPTTIRVRITRSAQAEDLSYAVDDLKPSEGLLQLRSDSVLTTDSLRVIVRKRPFRIRFQNAAGDDLDGDDPDLGVTWWGEQVTDYRTLAPDEHFIGWGEKTGPLDRRGQSFVDWNTDAFGYGLTQDPIYGSIPFYIGVHGRVCFGLFFDNSQKVFANFGGGNDDSLYYFGAPAGEMNYYFFGSTTVPGIIRDYTALTGRTPMPPLWSLGYQQSRWGYMNEHELLQTASTFREKHIPADVIYLDIQYMDHYKLFTWDSTDFPRPAWMVDSLKRMGFDLVTIIDPGVKVEPGYKAYEDGLAHHYFATYPDGKPFSGTVWPGRCYFPDFTRPEVRAWWGRQFEASHVANGIRGFWNDMNEPAILGGKEVPTLIEFGTEGHRATLNSVKNVYGLEMARGTYEGTKALLGGQRPFVLTRASYSGVQKYSAVWTGDNNPQDEHMLLGYRLLNSMGLCGVPFVGMDIPGFSGDASPELFLRWMSLGVYAPLFRNHTAIGNRYHEPWQYGEINTVFARKDIEERYRLLPYLYSVFYDAHETGMPVNRMLPIDYTYDSTVYDEAYGTEFLFGPAMLVCPVDSKTLISEVYLPGPGTTWYRLSTDEPYPGGKTAYVPSPLSDLPVFVKGGAIVAEQSVIQNTKESGDGVLYLNVWTGPESSRFEYYEDDGVTFGYESGQYYRRSVRYDPASSRIELGRVEGTFPSRFHRVRVVLHGAADWEGVKINGQMSSVTKDQKVYFVEFNNSDDPISIQW